MNFKTDILPLKDLLFRTALRITGCREEAEDVVQETLIKLWNQREKLSEVASLEAYAITLARNLSIDLLRKASVNTVTLDECTPANTSSENPYEKIYAREEIRRIIQVMALLPEKQRTCMHLRDFEGKNYREIADVMGISEDQVRINIYRARQFVKQNMLSGG